MTLSSTVSISTEVHCMYLFFFPPTLAIYGRNPDLNLTACVSQIRSVLCIQAISQGHRQILCPPANENARVQRLQVPGIRDPWSRILCSSTRPQRGLAISCAAAILPQTAMGSSQASPVLGHSVAHRPRVSILSARHGVPRTWGRICVLSTSSHLSGAWFTIQDDHHRMFSHHRH